MKNDIKCHLNSISFDYIVNYKLYAEIFGIKWDSRKWSTVTFDYVIYFWFNKNSLCILF